MVVQHNISAMTANRYYTNNNSALSKSMEKLSSGLAINRAGDNAAGLAVSEKMRAQIAGLTQASKNAQDGISMVQTFEGALQETDSILQRMRTLAVQSANGSYQNDVDRDALQLEFDQLNDELNQIADTDYNGVVALNGGTMADGLEADADGNFDYDQKKDQIKAKVGAEFETRLNNAKTALSDAKAEFARGIFDLSDMKTNGTHAPEWNTVDNSQYNKTGADELWVALGIVDSNNDADTSKADTVSITFKYDGTQWKADSARATLGSQDAGITFTGLDTAVTATSSSATGATGSGGFAVSVGTTDLGNAIFDATQAKDGSTLTLTFKNGTNLQIAPDNIGFNTTNGVTVTDDASATKALDKTKVAVALGANLTDANMTQAVDDALSAMEDLTVEFTINETTAPTAKIGSTNIATDKTNPTKITVGDGENAKSVYVYMDATDKKLHFGSDAATWKTGTDQKGVELATIDPGAANQATGYKGTIKTTISVSQHNYKDNSGNITLVAGDDPNLDSSAKLTAKVNAAQAALDAAQTALNDFNALDPDSKEEDWEKIKTLYAQQSNTAGTEVAISDSFDNSKSRLTYTENMTLQTGARSKDIVKFTFNYNSNGLGELKANMNCSAREDGLGTKNLSLKTQEDANEAIDKIDNAINKVSMVRGTFGAIQNRLEHKINNIDTNAENITAAESRIRDTQMDQEMMKFTSAQILSQASQSMLAQANSLPQGVLQLLG